MPQSGSSSDSVNNLSSRHFSTQRRAVRIDSHKSSTKIELTQIVLRLCPKEVQRRKAKRARLRKVRVVKARKVRRRPRRVKRALTRQAQILKMALGVALGQALRGVDCHGLMMMVRHICRTV
jgi:hypothetical protein